VSAVADRVESLAPDPGGAAVTVLPCRVPGEPEPPVDVELASGTTVVVRPVESADREALRRYLDELSPDGRYFRFLQAMPRVPESVLDLLTDGDGTRRLVLVALHGDEIVGEAILALDGEGCSAEVAYSVAAGVRRQGLASAMVRRLLGVASRRGLRSIHASVSPENRASAMLMASLGARHRFEDGLLVSELECCSPELIAA
jgi:acetyltransferase